VNQQQISSKSAANQQRISSESAVDQQWISSGSAANHQRTSSDSASNQQQTCILFFCASSMQVWTASFETLPTHEPKVVP
jgi:hypothetical protein